MRAPYRFLFCLSLIAAILLVGFPAAVRAQSLDAAARRLARRILSGAGEAPRVQLGFENRSSAAPLEAAAVRQALEAQLRALGARLEPASPDAPPAIQARVTLADRLGGFVLVAQIQRGEAGQWHEIAIAALAASALERQGSSENALSIHKRLVWQQKQPMVDFLEIPVSQGQTHTLAVLMPDSLALYTADGPLWRKENSFVIPHAAPWPRDLRGELTLAAGPTGPAALLISLPGMICGVSIAPPEPPGQGFSCKPADSFPMSGGSAHPAPGRNFFLEFGNSARWNGIPPFFSAALLLPAGGTPLLAVASTDGRTLFYDATGKVGEAADWGSDLVAVKTGCGRSGWQLLATGSGDWTASDSLRAYEVEAGEALPSGDPIFFPGPVLALWPSQEHGSARTIVRNLRTGSYEAYRLTLSCAP
jgi:hypothetical protein